MQCVKDVTAHQKQMTTMVHEDFFLLFLGIYNITKKPAYISVTDGISTT